VLVEQQKVPDSYVKSVVTGDIGQRLGTMQEQILSRTRLQPIIEKFGLFKNDRNKVAMEDLVDRLRKAISVTPIQSLVTTSAGELPGFTIAYTANDPRLAQQVCAEITSMFIEENLRLREQRAVGTTDFLKNELEQAKQKLDAQDAKLAEFKRKYMGSLPGDEQTDMNMMTGFSSQLEAVTSQLNRAQQDKTYEESLLAQQVSAWKMSQVQKAEMPHEDILKKELAVLQAQLVSMQTRYTPNHPDIMKMKEDIAALKKKIEDSEAAPPETTAHAAAQPVGIEPLEIEQIRLLIHQAESIIREKTREQARLREQLGTYQARLSMSPAVEEQLKELTRDYQTALLFYNDLLAKKSQSEMATNLERRQQGDQFRVMDPPDLPERPSFPNRRLFAGGGLGMGLILGIGITLLLEFRDKTLRTENDVEQFLGLPTLAMVPLISDANGNKQPRARTGQREGAQLIQSARV
jgi:polysaccharide chain length determinant protein (PEP-CTERM system associated)